LGRDRLSGAGGEIATLGLIVLVSRVVSSNNSTPGGSDVPTVPALGIHAVASAVGEGQDQILGFSPAVIPGKATSEDYVVRLSMTTPSRRILALASASDHHPVCHP
jgi:hypothetical protein